MKVDLLNIGFKNPNWLDEALAGYDRKINFQIPFQRKLLKSKSSARDEASEKIKSESKEILNAISDKAYLILLDEKGKGFKSSKAFSEKLQKVLSGTANEIVFLIGGAYGVSEDVRKRANETWSLSDLTFNHHLVQLVFCEQLYRGLAIWKGLPYHND